MFVMTVRPVAAKFGLTSRFAAISAELHDPLFTVIPITCELQKCERYFGAPVADAS
jgi:hypothetical protein